LASRSSSGTVLVVEDDTDIREAVAEVLEMEGFTVATASNGREGLERLVALGRPCMILLDLMMPVMDGHEFLDRLATDPLCRTCPVVVFTAGQAAPPPGAKELLRKPFEICEMIALVKALCPKG
jgi:CheY-like chemotaxis protein